MTRLRQNCNRVVPNTGGYCLMRFVYHSGGPGSVLALILFLALLILFFIVLPANIAAHAAEGLGLTPVQGIVLLITMVLTRGVEFTVYRSERLVREVLLPDTPFFELLRMRGFNGMDQAMYGEELVPQTFGITLGGMALPLAMSLVFLARVAHVPGALAWSALVIAISIAVCFASTRYRQGLAPRLPVVVPPVCAALAAFMLPQTEYTAAAAFAGAVIGPLAGSGLVPLLWPRTRGRVDAPRVVFGGTQMFWGIFFGCVVAGLVA
jgi:uncharacterized membrane protein